MYFCRRLLGIPVTVTFDTAVTALIVAAAIYTDGQVIYLLDPLWFPEEPTGEERIRATLDDISHDEASTKAALPGP